MSSSATTPPDDSARSSATPPVGSGLAGRRIWIVGKLAGMGKREARRCVKEHGAVLVDTFDPSVDLIVVGESGSGVVDAQRLRSVLPNAARDAVQSGQASMLRETEFWQRLELLEPEVDVCRHYTPGMAAELLKLPVAQIRSWHRRGLLRASREVRRLPYFEFSEIATARRLKELAANGASPAALVKYVASLRKLLPNVERPLSELSVLADGKHLLLRREHGLFEPDGQKRFDFEAPSEEPEVRLGLALQTPEAEVEPLDDLFVPTSPAELARAAAEFEDDGKLQEAADCYRAALAAGGLNSQICFALAEVLYRQGDLSGARERYSTAVELDEDYVEARANLGCVYAEQGRLDLAEAAFTGALAYHPHFLDARFHLAQTLDQLGRPEEAETHWRTFLQLAPDNPWADVARQRLGEDSTQE